MCAKSPASAEHCALLTEGPARHGSCFANFHSLKLNSLLSYFSSASWTGKEGHTAGQANSASCRSAEDLCNGIWWSTAVGKTQLKWPTFSKHGAHYSSLTWKWCRKYDGTFPFVSACWENALPASSALGGCTVVMSLLCATSMTGMDKEDTRWWVSRAALFLQDSAPLGPHVV